MDKNIATKHNNKIELLSDNLINKIAAGEVVDRPFSVVKELVENSIDAKAQNITVIIRDGGKKLIEIIDDGIGLDENSLILAFERHATSKIKYFKDLEVISTMGFRGEALPSIASVSMVEALSKPRGTEDGFIMKINGGVISDVKPTPLKSSTIIRVKSLFYNIPARRKFLKDSLKEYKSIYTFFKKITLANPNIGFKLINNDKVIFNLKAEKLEERISNLFPEIDSESLFDVTNNHKGYTLRGFIGKKEISRRSRDNQLLFVNNRIVENKMINYSVFQGYKNVIEQGYYPFFILFLSTPPGRIDVNVHPAKLEIKFHEENLVRLFVKETITEKLSGQTSLVSLDLEQSNVFNNDIQHQVNVNNAFQDKKKEENTNHIQEDHESSQENLFEKETASSQINSNKNNKEYNLKNDIDNSTKVAENTSTQTDENKFLKPQTRGVEILKFGQERIVSESVWQLQNKYIVAEIESGMMIIDQHVAQERIFYEKALTIFSIDNDTKNNNTNETKSQVLLFPVNIDLSFEDKLTLEEIKDYLHKIGYTISSFGQNSYIIEGVPAGIKIGDEKEEILSILDYHKKFREKRTSILDSVAASYACKRAIKAGHKLQKDEMIALINDLFLCQFPHVCPHGRPIIVNVTMKELDKKFMRI